MKSSLFEHYKKKYAIGGKTPVRKTGMWYQNGDVVVPSSEITMKGPNGEKDYFDSPIMGIGMLSGDTQVMQPGQDYSFPNDNAVYEKKMQIGAKVKNENMTPEQQARFNSYLKSSDSRNIKTPEWLELSSGATNYARRLNRMSQQELIGMPGDISQNVNNAFRQGIDYSLNVPTSAGQFSTEGSYNPFGENTVQDMYSGLTYTKNLPKGSIRISPEEQKLTYRGKKGNVSYKKKMSDEEQISELAFNLNFLPESLSIYGGGKTSNGLLSATGKDPKFQVNDNYNINAGVRGDIGPLSYDVSGNYNPETGYRYNADAQLSLLKDRLQLSGNVEGSQELGLESISAEARAKILKNLNVKAGYRQSGNNPSSYNIGLSYNKAFGQGGMSIPGVNGSVIASAPMTLQKQYKNKNKK
jgi:hypothetical protein